ncbi:hypothetical protein MYAM1_002037 [Malassezia yamatoensis]|uniref:DUF1014-domain-containing protein n=1 Tax=Malassezia yamatoensis TaxID=253288 RepID=A0AAJ5YU52_9BASI|nr:hypothetical protein MYAM1_002037 [Malassezia yamatoensis]
MPAKMNAKAVQGRARKAEAADRKAAQEAEVREQEEDQKWQKGAKGKTAADDRREKEDAKSRKREELKRLQEEDEASTPGKKSSGKQSNNTKPSAKAKGSAGPNDLDDLDMQIASFNASSLDDALEAMTLVNDRSDKASRGAAAGALEKHPERRFKAAFEAYKERQLPKLREEHPGLRLQQYNDLLYKQFQKSPENPFNQLHVSYDASKEDKLSLLKAKRDASARRLAA